MWDSGFRTQSLGVEGFGFGDWGLRCRVEGFRFGGLGVLTVDFGFSIQG